MGIFSNRKKYFKETELKTETQADMGSKITKGLEHMKNFSSQYLTIVTFIGIILGGYKVYDKWDSSNTELKENFEVMMKSQNDEQKLDSLLLKGQTDLRSDLEEHLKYSSDYAKQLQSLQKSYIKYISNDDALTKTDFLEYMEGLSVEEKKSLSLPNDTTKREYKIGVKQIEK